MNIEQKAREIISEYAGMNFDQITILSPKTVQLMLESVIADCWYTQQSVENHNTHELMQSQTTLRACCIEAEGMRTAIAELCGLSDAINTSATYHLLDEEHQAKLISDFEAAKERASKWIPDGACDHDR